MSMALVQKNNWSFYLNTCFICITKTTKLPGKKTCKINVRYNSSTLFLAWDALNPQYSAQLKCVWIWQCRLGICSTTGLLSQPVTVTAKPRDCVIHLPSSAASAWFGSPPSDPVRPTLCPAYAVGSIGTWQLSRPGAEPDQCRRQLQGPLN